MNTGMPVESPVRGDVHAGFGGRVGETDQPKGWHRASARPYTFRFNRRRSRSRGLVFYRVLELAVAHKPVRYREIVANPSPGKARRPPPGTRGRPPTLQRRRARRPWRRATSLHSG